MGGSQTGILLVGSVPLASEEEVLRTSARILGSRAFALPDGETGARTNWINWQKSVMDATPMLAACTHEDGYGAVQVDLYAMRPNFDGERTFPPLGYADAAIASYATFSRLLESGAIAVGTRFLVALPTPFAPLVAFIEPGSFSEVEPHYAAAMRREVEAILAAVPHDRLAIQWDAALEFAVLEGVFPSPEKDLGALVSRMAGLTSLVPEDVPVGFHLCYGDADHHHFKEPQDAALMVRVANAVSAASKRRIDWLHLPVPIERDDDGFFAPLAELALGQGCELYLGLVHARDGVEGAVRRARTAQKFIERFGVATECGFGRRAADTVVPLLELQVEAASALDRG